MSSKRKKKPKLTLDNLIKGCMDAGMKVDLKMGSPGSDSDLVKAVRQLEQKRADKEAIAADNLRIDNDLKKVLEYYEGEKAKLDQQKAANIRSLKVVHAEIENLEEITGVNRPVTIFWTDAFFGKP